MQFSIRQEDVIINIECTEGVAKSIKKFFKGFLEMGEKSMHADINVKINDSFSNIKNGENLIDIEELNSKYLSKISMSKKEIDVYLNDKEKIQANYDVVKMLLANLYAKLLEEKGYVFLHASAAAKNGKAILISGEKDTGKTSNMLTLLNDGYDFVTNDMLAVKIKNNKLIGYGMPHYVGIRLTKPWITNPENQKYLDFAASRNFSIDADNPSDDMNKLYISPANISKINKVSVKQGVEIIGILNTHFGTKNKKFDIERMAREENKKLIVSQLLEPLHPTKSFLNDIKIDYEKPYTIRTIAKLVKTPIYKIILNENTNDLFVKASNKILGGAVEDVFNNYTDLQF